MNIWCITPERVRRGSAKVIGEGEGPTQGSVRAVATLRLGDGEQVALLAGHGAGHSDVVVLNLEDLEVLHGRRLPPHAPRVLDARVDARWRRAGSGAAMFAVGFGPVCHEPPLEAVALDVALETLPDRVPPDVHFFALSEQCLRGELQARLERRVFGIVGQAVLLQVPQRRGPPLSQVPQL